MDQTTPNIRNEINVPQLSMPDHDLLIKLDTKMDGLAASFNQYYTDLTMRVSKLENRMDKEDLYHAGIDLPHLKGNSEWVDGWRSNWRLIIGVFSGVAAITGGVVSTFIIHWLHL
jgi:hypothetical protein